MNEPISQKYDHKRTKIWFDPSGLHGKHRLKSCLALVEQKMTCHHENKILFYSNNIT